MFWKIVSYNHIERIMNNSSGFNTVSLAADLLEKSFIKGMHIASAESLTGGLLADAFVSVPGASRVFVDLLSLMIFMLNPKFLA